MTGSLEGVVRDSSAGVFAAAQVRVVNAGSTSLTTNAAGRFLAVSLPLGNYKVILEAQGFNRLERAGLTLDVNQALVLDLTMELGATKETVEVTLRGTLLDTSLVNLPPNERNSWQLVFLAPGVQGSVGSAFPPFTPGLPNPC